MSCLAGGGGPSDRSPLETSPVVGTEGAPASPSCIPWVRGKQGGTLVLVSSDGLGLETQRHSVTLADAVASCAPKPPDVEPADSGADDPARLLRKVRISGAEAPLSFSRAVTVPPSMT